MAEFAERFQAGTYNILYLPAPLVTLPSMSRIYLFNILFEGEFE